MVVSKNGRGRAMPPYKLDRKSLEENVRIDVYRSSGPGGQHVNRTESAVRVTHWPSGVVVTASDTRSQLRNREIAFARLSDRLRRLNQARKKRVPTRIGAAAKTRRMEAKNRQSALKRSRRRLLQDD